MSSDCRGSTTDYDRGVCDAGIEVGIIGTPIIDPNTDIMYFYSKSYKGGL